MILWSKDRCQSFHEPFTLFHTHIELFVAGPPHIDVIAFSFIALFIDGLKMSV